jgi:hypothetical protein
MRFLLGVTAAFVFLAAAWPQDAAWRGDRRWIVGRRVQVQQAVYRIGAEKRFYRRVRVRKLPTRAN